MTTVWDLLMTDGHASTNGHSVCTACRKELSPSRDG